MKVTIHWVSFKTGMWGSQVFMFPTCILENLMTSDNSYGPIEQGYEAWRREHEDCTILAMHAEAMHAEAIR